MQCRELGAGAGAGGMVRKDPDMTVRRRFVTGGSDCLVKIWDWKYVFFLPSGSFAFCVGGAFAGRWRENVVAKLM